MKRWLIVSIAAACGGAAAPKPYVPVATPACTKIHPVPITIAPPEVATAATPRELAVPESLILEVQRTGLIRVSYTPAGCAGAHSSKFPDLDRFLDAHVADLGLTQPGCYTIWLSFGGACDVPQTLD